MNIRDTWRDAAMRDQLQYYGIFDPFILPKGRTASYNSVGYNRPHNTPGEKGHCALTIIYDEQHHKMPNVEALRCPACDEAKDSGHPSDLMVHLNNVHRWTWLDLACKFPPILPEDQV